MIEESGFEFASSLLKCDVAAIKAVCDVESRGSGFLSDGRPKILFEGHHFSRLTKHKYDLTYPSISYPKWTRRFYSSNGEGEWRRLEAAISLNRVAALMSASWGMFQIMGFNFGVCGFTSVEDFVASMRENELNHLKAFCRFVIHSHIDDEIREHRWADFARIYNGPGYRENEYDKKLRAAWVKYSGLG